MFFEGTEKKLEVITNDQCSLRKKGREFWEKVVNVCEAKILSSINNDKCDAYLLSESSLFVWDDRFLMITCGKTYLIKSALLLTKFLKEENINSLIFQRKNEYRSYLQYSSFFDDVKLLNNHIKGDSILLGKNYSTHNMLFYSNKEFKSKTSDITVEILIYGLGQDILSWFKDKNKSIRSFLNLEKYFPDFQIDDYYFDPVGYSLNAINLEGKYYTIHITPEKDCPYLSFECNVEINEEFVEYFAKICNADDFDLVTFNHSLFNDSNIQGFQRGIFHKKRLKNNYLVEFSQFSNKYSFKGEPKLLDVKKYVSPWKTEHCGDFLNIQYKIDNNIYSKQSEFQKVDIVKTRGHGKMLLNDDLVMISERDEFIYHEMISHVPLFIHPDPKNILIIGGGDGGTAREVLRHKNIKKCTMVEIDEVVIQSCIEHIPLTSKCLTEDNPNFNLIIGDGVEFVRNTDKKFDIIIVDSTDPIGPATPLFGEEFYENVFNCLSDNGIVVSQGESPFYDLKTQKVLLSILNKIFNIVRVYNYSNLTYPGGIWSFSFASKGLCPIGDFDKNRVLESNLVMKYYNCDIHLAAFSLPEFMKQDLTRYFK